jgi:hypothetical protein
MISILHLPFSLLQISEATRALHIMARTVSRSSPSNRFFFRFLIRIIDSFVIDATASLKEIQVSHLP